MNITAVIVTYSSRFSYLERVLAKVAGEPLVTRIVLIDNASAPETRAGIAGFECRYPEKLKVVRNSDNRGSAGGFSQGIAFAAGDPSCTHIWLLDDDNLPDDNCLTVLVRSWNKLSAEYGKDLLCLSAYRREREIYKTIAVKGQSARDILVGEENSYQGYHIRHLFRWLSRGVFERAAEGGAAGTREELPIDLAPWGGMFFSSGLVRAVGLPNEDYYLCMDDWEYSDRIISGGGKIFLVPASGIQDIDVPEQGDTLGNSIKFYYGRRNSVWFSKTRLKRSPAVYACSRLMGRLLFAARLAGKDKKTKEAYSLAIKDAESGRMGKKDYPFLVKS